MNDEDRTVSFTVSGQDWVLIDGMLDFLVQEEVVHGRDPDVAIGQRLRDMLAETIDSDLLDRQYSVPLTRRQRIFLMYYLDYASHFRLGDTMAPAEEALRLLALRDALLAVR